NLVPTRPRRRPRNRSWPVSDYVYEDDDEDDTKPLPQRPATVLSVLLGTAAKLHLCDLLPGHGAVQVADVSARRPQVSRRSAVQAFVAEITDRLDGPVAAVRSDGTAITGRPVVHVRENGRGRPDVRTGLSQLLRREPGFATRQQLPWSVGVPAEVIVADDEPIALLNPAGLRVEGSAQVGAAHNLVGARVADHLGAHSARKNRN